MNSIAAFIVFNEYQNGNFSSEFQLVAFVAWKIIISYWIGCRQLLTNHISFFIYSILDFVSSLMNAIFHILRAMHVVQFYYSAKEYVFASF